METQTRSNPRTCVGCKKTGPKRELLRFVHDGGAVTADVRGCAPGRGAWVHPRRECLAAASAHGFSRSFRTRVRRESFTGAAEACRAEVDRVVARLARQGTLVTDAGGLERAASNERAVVLHAADAFFRGEIHARRFVHDFFRAGCAPSPDRMRFDGAPLPIARPRRGSAASRPCDQRTFTGIGAVSALAIELEDEARRVVSLLERAIALSEDA